MPITILIGAQWGDEGKGRFVDHYAASADVVARYSGGDNAGHTIAIADQVYKMHLIPSGIIHPGVTAVMGNGMVINPVNLVNEMQHLHEQGVSITPDNLFISSRAHLITPGHIELDRAKEAARGASAIGTTLRGIGPAYLDKADRRGLRVGDMRDLEHFAESLRDHLHVVNEELRAQQMATLDVTISTQAVLDAAATLRPFIHDTSAYLNERLREGAQVVAEGAQGTLLDVDHGSYPFVTSSSPTVGGVLTGLGVGPQAIGHVIGVAKAFSTRVGGGPMPTELEGPVAEHLRGTGVNFWDEFGTTTGRPRRCGWLDSVLLRYAVRVNGFDEIVLTKLDILSGLDELKIATAYRINGEAVAYPPATLPEFERVEVICETLPGWSDDITGVRNFNDLPVNARNYVQRVAELCGVPVYTLSVGPERQQIIQRRV